MISNPPRRLRDDGDIKTTLRHARQEKMWTVKRAAKMCGYSSAHWRNFESGAAVPVIERLQAICEQLDLPLLKTFRLWAYEKLDNVDSSSLRQLLGHINLAPAESNTKGSQGCLELIRRVEQIPFDEKTALLAYRLIELVATYRSGLTWNPASKREVQVFSIPDEINKASWNPFSGSKLTTEHRVGWNLSGLGYLATVIRIEPGCGGFHQHLENRFLDTGMEFFSVLRGTGYGFFERQRDWKSARLRSGTVGLYPGIRGHAYVNTGHEPLLVHIVCVPFPPLMLEDTSQRRTSAGDAKGAEFRVSEVSKTRLPSELKKVIRNKCGLVP